MNEEQMREVQGVVSPGARAETPVEIGSEMEAVDLSDDFVNPAGDVPIGSIVAVSRVGSKYVFHKP
jgi:hypothetical protein